MIAAGLIRPEDIDEEEDGTETAEKKTSMVTRNRKKKKDANTGATVEKPNEEPE